MSASTRGTHRTSSRGPTLPAACTALVIITTALIALWAIDPAWAAGAAPSSAPAPPAPSVALSPASGPVGTRVTFSGTLTPDQLAAYGNQLRHPAYFTLETELKTDCQSQPTTDPCATGTPQLAGCELLITLSDTQITVDAPHQHVAGSFSVGSTGSCFQGQPVSHVVTIPAGRYFLIIGPHGGHVGIFTVTAAQLAVTGFSPVLAVALGAVLVSIGIWLARARAAGP